MFRPHHELEQALMHTERHFVDVGGVHPLLVLAGVKIELGKERCAAKFFEHLHHWDGKFVLDGVVVHAEMPRVIALLDKQDRCRERRCTWADHAGAQHVNAQPLELLLLAVGIPVWLDCH
jgi:hypothetical protein